MVLESLLSPESAESSPSKIMLLSFIFVSLGVWLAEFVKIRPLSIMTIVFTVIPSVPLLLKLYDFEEERVAHGSRVLGSRTLARHAQVLVVLVSYFVGLTIAFTFWYVALPVEKSAEHFDLQLDELKRISSGVEVKLVARAVEGVSGWAVNSLEAAFEFIFLNNLGVLVLIIAFSILYGAGATFILVWNAAIVGVFIGNIAQKFVFQTNPALSVLAGAGYGALGIVPHGIFELLSYQTGGLAGGILSSAIVRKVYKKPEFRDVLKDVFKLLAWAVVFLAIGALIEGNALALK